MGRFSPFEPAREADVGQLGARHCPEADAANFRKGWKGDVGIGQSKSVSLGVSKDCVHDLVGLVGQLHFAQDFDHASTITPAGGSIE
jgi:hypothetical protein